MANQGYYGQAPPFQSHSPYPPPQGGYAPQHQPCGQPPPQMNQYQQPPPQGYGPPPGASPYPPQQNAYGPPPGQAPFGQQPPAPYGAPPPNQFGGPPQQYGGPPPGQYGPPTPPSPGYVYGQRSNQDMSRAADELRAAMKGFGTNENVLIRTLAPMDPYQVEGVKFAFQQRHKGRDLMKDITSETSGYFREGLLAICRGPLEQDCHTLHESIKGLGTKESAMNEVLLARSNADMEAIKRHYQHLYHKTLESDVGGDLSMKTERLFGMVMSARRTEESAPVIPQQTDADIQELHRATEGKVGTDQMTVCSILTSRSNGQVRAISLAYEQKYRRALTDTIKSEFSGHMQDALLYIVSATSDPAKHDAWLLEDAMQGLGTKDVALVRRIVMIHWDRQRLQQCKAAYKHFYKQDIAQRIRSETRGDYEKLMVACTQ